MEPSELAQRASALVGRIVRDKWRIDALIGVGGMASVFAATHRNGKRGALKLLHQHLSLDASMKARFLREGYVANKVGHPGAVGALDDDTTEDGQAFFVMELLEGESVKSRWRRAPDRRLHPAEVLWIADHVLDILAAAHERGIIHRDLKPDNIFVCSDGSVRVLDFGIARLHEHTPGADVTRTGAMLGTPAYMPQEQARARWELVDGRTDLWAVGATMFALLTGEFVHAGETAAEIVVAAATNAPRPLLSVTPALSPSIAAVVDRALAFDPAQRWQDARSMQAAVRAALAETMQATHQPMQAPKSVQAPQSSVPMQTPPNALVTDSRPSAMVQSGGGSTTGAVSGPASAVPRKAKSGSYGLVVLFATIAGIGVGAVLAFELHVPIPFLTPTPAAAPSSAPAVVEPKVAESASASPSASASAVPSAAPSTSASAPHAPEKR